MELVNPNGRSHRTALVVNGAAYDEGGDYAERVNRLVESLNGPQIKTDIFKTVGDKVVRCQNSAPLTPVVEDASASNEASAHAVLSAEGYTQILASAPSA